MKKKILIKVFFFLLGLLVIFYRLNMILILKEYPVGPNVNILLNPYLLSEKQEGFYSLPDDCLDVVFIGSSNIHCNVNPNVIWNEYGITSYDYSCDQQELGTSYYYLQQVFETQSPKVVVVDLLDNGEFDSIDTTKAHYAFDHMKKDRYWIEGIWNRTKDARCEMYFPILAYHDRWKELGENDFKYKRNQYNILKGSFIYMVSNEQVNPQIPEDLPRGELSERTKYWLDSIIRICNEHNCKCLFIKTPFAFYEDGWFSYFNAIEEYCNEKEVPFLYMNKLANEIGIDFTVDYADNMHMNWNGQNKLSKYVGAYLVENYKLINKHGLSQYSRWDDDYAEMIKYVENFWDLYWAKEKQ